MNLMNMLEQGSVFHLTCMGVILILIIVMVYRIGKGVEAKFAGEKETPHVQAAVKTQDGTIAAITAAVKQYKKNKYQ